ERLKGAGMRWAEHGAATVSALRALYECQVVLANPFQEIAFGFSSWFPEEAIVLRPALSEPWFHSIRPVGHAVRGNGIQHPLVEPAAAFGIIARPQRDHRLERFQRLDRPLE